MSTLSTRQIIRSIILVLCFLFFETLFYKIVVLIVAIVLFRQSYSRRWMYYSLLGVCVVGLYLTSPRIRWNTNDRIRLIYQDDNYQPQNMPLHHWLLNTLIPEPEAVNIALPFVKLSGYLYEQTGYSLPHLPCHLFAGFAHDEHSFHDFKEPYRHLEYNGQFLASGIVSQAFNTVGGHTRSVYVIRPKNYDKDKTYPVVVFLHGGLGSYQFYTGMMLGLDDYIVIQPATNDLSGCWNSKDLSDIVNHQLPFLETLGYKIDKKNVHLIGLSNGAYYGSSEAVRDYGNKFRSVTFAVGGKTTQKQHPHELHIYSKRDLACPGSVKKYDEVRSTPNYLYFPCCSHFLNAYHAEEVREYLKARWKEM